MAKTVSQSQEHVRNVAVGRYLDTGTAAAFVITVGFKPRVVRVINVDSGDVMEWYEGMADASGCKTTGSTGARSKVTSNGLTISQNGFTVGLDTDVNVTNEQISWEAVG